jgi:hypothetical protein
MYINVYVCSGGTIKEETAWQMRWQKQNKGSDCVMESMGNACNGQDDIVQGLWQPDPE